MGKVKAIPEGYHAITPFYCIKGSANEFIETLKKAFGAEERMRMPGPNNSVMHCELVINGSTVMVSDSMQDPPTHSATHYYVNDCDAVVQRATAAGFKTIQPPTDMPWGDRFARLEDKWGNRWSVATHIEDVPPDEMRKRMEAMMQQAMKK
jgi:PhnB protein